MYYVAYTMLNYPNSIVSKTSLFYICLHKLVIIYIVQGDDSDWIISIFSEVKKRTDYSAQVVNV